MRTILDQDVAWVRGLRLKLFLGRESLPAENILTPVMLLLLEHLWVAFASSGWNLVFD